MRMAGRLLPSLAALSAVTAGPALAQDKYPEVEIAGRVQQQFYWFDNDVHQAEVGPQSNFFTRRARIEASGRIAEHVSFKIQPSFEGGRTSGVRLRDAYIDVRLTSVAALTSLTLRVGQDKRPFSRYELTSSTNLPSIERGAGDGLPGEASNDLFEGAGFLSHDVGASLLVEHRLNGDRTLRLTAGVYNGQGESLDDVNDRKSFGARATMGITKKVDVGASWFTHDGIVDEGVAVDSSFTNRAWGVDAQYGKPGDERLYALVEYLHGDAFAPGKPRMRGFQAVAAWHVRAGGSGRIYAWEPFARLDLADPDTDTDDDGTTTLTAGLGLYLSSKAWLRVAYERQSFQADAAESVSGVRSMLAVSF